MAELAAARITIGIVWKLFAPATARRLEQGDVTEEKIRQILLSEFNKIHESLNVLRRKELVAAVAFMETGFELLGKDMKTSKEEFRKARDAAHMAFGVVPEVTDKILATKIMVTSAFYEFQDDNIDTARTLCCKYLERMNTMPEVVRACEMMYTPQKSVAGKILSMSGKNKRTEILQNAAEVNMSVWNYMRDFLRMEFKMQPAIRFGSYKVNPVDDLVLQRKPSVIAEIEKCLTNFISVTMSPDYIFAALGETQELQRSNAILALNVNTSKVSHLLVHEKTVMSVVFDGYNLCSGSADNAIVIWDIPTLTPKKIVQQHEGSVRSLCCTDTYLISGSADSTIRIWEREKDYEGFQVLSTGSPVMVVRASRRKFLFCLVGISTTQIWDTNKFVILHEINIAAFGRATVPNTKCMELITNDNTMIIPVKSEDGEHIQCWNLGSLSMSGCIPETGQNIAKFHQSPYVFCGTEKVKMINIKSGRTIIEHEIVLGSEIAKHIIKMWTDKCYLYLLCQTHRDRFYIVKY